METMDPEALNVSPVLHTHVSRCAQPGTEGITTESLPGQPFCVADRRRWCLPVIPVHADSMWLHQSGPCPAFPRLHKPPIPIEHIGFIQQISSDPPEYGEDRIALELEIKFGIRHASSTIRRFMVKRRSGPTDPQTWRSFLKNQAKAMWSGDLFVQPTVAFQVLYIFVVMELASRKVVHLHVTDHPTLEWTKRQIRNVCFEEQPKFLIHDNDGKFGPFGRPLRVENAGERVSCRSAFDAWLWTEMGIRGIALPYGAPNAVAHIERLIGIFRRECLYRMPIWNERHLRRVLTEFVAG
jgi:putative transposase